MNTTATPAQACPRCANCGEMLLPRQGGMPPQFYPACGQEGKVQAPTLREFAQQ